MGKAALNEPLEVFQVGPPDGTETVRWLLIALVALALLVAAFAVTVGSALVPCHTQLVDLPEPASWRSWPVAPHDAGYLFEGTLSYPRRPLYAEIHGTGPGVCTDGVLPLPRWLAGGDQDDALAKYHAPHQLSIRQDPGGSEVLVVEGHADAREPVFVAAFRRDDTRWVYVSRRSRLLLVTLAIAIATLLVAIARALGSLRLGRLLGDTERVREGFRDATGTVRLVDDGFIVAPAPPGPPGPVLVRVGHSSPGTYREPSLTRNVRTWNGRREDVARRNRDGAARGLRWAVVLAVGLGVAACIVAFVLEVSDAWRST
jgi:hypothetical protein